jgi:phage tail protein X
MSKTYTTVQGDHWDSIAYSQMGSTAYTDRLMWANRAHIGTFQFSSGVVLTIPEVRSAAADSTLPPWKR